MPQELFELDVLDGSPPCSSFSMSGNRDKDWGKHKQFREGQQKQVLDTLFFDFVDLAKRLQPKVVVAENVPGILYGKAKAYADKICDSLNQAGYEVMHYLLDAQRMGVPQRRKRVFFIAVRKDIAAKTVLKYPLSMDFVGPSIPARAVQICGYNDHSWTAHDTNVWTNRQATDKAYSDVLMRLEGRNSN